MSTHTAKVIAPTGPQFGPAKSASGRALISESDAQVVGEAIEAARRRAGAKFSTAHFEDYCADPANGRVHDLWKKHKARFEKRAGREAASFLIKAVIRIVPSAQVTSQPPRAFIPVRSPEMTQTAQVVPVEDVRRKFDVMERAKADFRIHVGGDIARFAAIVGIEAAKEEVLKLLEQLS